MTPDQVLKKLKKNFKSIWPTCNSVHCLRGRKRALYSLELELQTVLNHHVGGGNLGYWLIDLGWRDGSVVKSTCCFSRGPEFNS